MGELMNIRHSDGSPEPDGVLKDTVKIKIRYYRNIYLNHPDPIDFIPLVVDTTGRLYDEFIRLLFLDSHREGSVLDHDENISYVDFHPPGPLISVFHTVPR